MDSQIALFGSVLARLLESFAHHVNIALSQLDNVLMTQLTPQAPEQIVMSFFPEFPRGIPEYVMALETLADVAECNPAAILKNVCKTTKNIIKRQVQLTPFVAMQSLSPAYRQDNPLHTQLITNFAMFFMSDLICHMIVALGPNTSLSSVALCGYMLCEPGSLLPTLHKAILRQWSAIFSLVSETNFVGATDLFSYYSATDSIETGFRLVRYIRFDKAGDPTFLEDLLQLVPSLIRKKQLTTIMLKCIASMLRTVRRREDILASFFEIAWSLRKENNLKEGALVLICSLFPLLPKTKSKVSAFYKDRVFAHAQVISKLSRSLKLFQLLIFGSLPDPRWVAWSWGPSPPVARLAFVGWNSEPQKRQSEGNSFTSLFMRHFFSKSNLSVSLSRSRDTILSLASLDFENFTTAVVPSFLSLAPTDPRLPALLTALPLINSEDFTLHSLTNVGPSSLDTLNRLVRPKIFTLWPLLAASKRRPGLIQSMSTRTISTRVSAADRVVESTLVSRGFTPLVLNFENANPYPPSLLSYISAALPSSLPSNQLDPEVILDLAFSSDTTIAIPCLTLIKQSKNLTETLISYLTKLRSPEAHHGSLSLLLETLPDPIPMDLIYDLEVIAFVSLASPYPETRIIAFSLCLRIPSGAGELINSHRAAIEGTAGINLGGSLPITEALGTRFYDAWLPFLSEIASLLVAADRRSLLSRLQNIIPPMLSDTAVTSPHVVSLLILLLAADSVPLAVSNSSLAVSLVSDMLESDDGWRDEAALLAIPYAHPSLHPSLARALARVPPSLVPSATSVLHQLLKSAFLLETRSPSLAFLSLVQSHLISTGANSPRVIVWDPSGEQKVLSSSPMVISYCGILLSLLSRGAVPESEWSLPSREITFRFLLNWCNTRSPSLGKIRNDAAAALGAVVRAGTLLTDTLLVDLTELSALEGEGQEVLSFLLYFHVDLLLPAYAAACLELSNSDGSLVLSAIPMALGAGRAEAVRASAGPLILAAEVYKAAEHPRAAAVLDGVKSLLGEASPTEAVIQAALLALQNPALSIPAGNIIKPLYPYFRKLRLLPKQRTCEPSAVNPLKKIPPLDLLTNLMITAENRPEAVSLWPIMAEAPEHQDLLPVFAAGWSNADTKTRVFEALLKSSPAAVFRRLVGRLSFAYYAHAGSLSKEMWSINLLTSHLDSASPDSLAALLHFSWLYSDKEGKTLFENFRSHFNVREEGRGAIRVLGEKSGQSTQWAAEAARYVVGSQDIEFSIKSLVVINELRVSPEPLLVTGVCKSVAYHLASGSDCCTLAAEAFTFYANCFSGNEIYAFKFASSFLDCSQFVEGALLSAAQLFIKSLSSQLTNSEAWSQIVSIVRPLLPTLEFDERSQKILELLIKTSGNEDLKMIVAPIRLHRPDLFPSAGDVLKLIDQASTTALCKAVVHYAAIVEGASEGVREKVFWVSALTVDKAADENTRGPLAVIYKTAVSAIPGSSEAVRFLRAVARKEPGVAVKGSNEVYSGRSVYDVMRAVGRLVVEHEGNFQITDCQTLASVYNMLDSDVPQKIMPFAAQKEMLEGMTASKTAGRVKRAMSVRRSSHAGSSMVGFGGPVGRPSLLVAPAGSGTGFGVLEGGDYGPLDAPQSIRLGLGIGVTRNLIMSPDDFLNVR